MSLSLRTQLASKRRALVSLLVVWTIATFVSEICLRSIYDDTDLPLLSSIATSSAFGLVSLPMSFLHLFMLKGTGIIDVSGRPGLLGLCFLYRCGLSALQFLTITRRSKLLLLTTGILILLSAPYWAYYSQALMGV